MKKLIGLISVNHKPESEIKDQITNAVYKYYGQITPNKYALVAIGFLFRTYFMVIVFWDGVRLLTNPLSGGSGLAFTVRLIGILFIFISIYLLINLLLKRLRSQTYYLWGGVTSILIAVIFLFLAVNALTGSPSIIPDFLHGIRWWFFTWK